MKFTSYRSTKARPVTYADFVDDFVEQAELRFPIHLQRSRVAWALERYDVVLVFLYCAACRRAEGTLCDWPFVRTSTSAPTVCSLGFPRCYWNFLERRGLGKALAALPPLEGIPPVAEATRMLVRRFDDAYL
jgi:hypothetical protein